VQIAITMITCILICSATEAAEPIAADIAFLWANGHISLMETELITPERAPKTSSHATSTFGCFLAAAGATLSTLCLLGAGMAATVWAFAKLLGFPDQLLYVALAISMLPVLWATVWTAGRAWHVERRLASGKDIDVPVFTLMHYLR
jgi:hypothetical protein